MQFNSIQTDLLGSFKLLKYIIIYENTFERLVHRQGISWLASINADIRVKNMSDMSELARYGKRRLVVVKLDNWKDGNFVDKQNDRDFCLYKVSEDSL